MDLIGITRAQPRPASGAFPISYTCRLLNWNRIRCVKLSAMLQERGPDMEQGDNWPRMERGACHRKRATDNEEENEPQMNSDEHR